MATKASQPTPISPKFLSPATIPSHRTTTTTVAAAASTITSTGTAGYSSTSGYRLDSSVDTVSGSSRSSLSSLHLSLPEHARIYDFSEIRAATNNFLAKRYSTSSSSSQSWRCELLGKDVIVFQRKVHRPMRESELKAKLTALCRSHHLSIIKLIGASISKDHIYLVYDFAKGSSLAACLRNPRSPNFTVLSTWMSRMQIATDLAHGLDYIHHTAGFTISLVHKHLKSSGVIITEPSLNARICHFGAAELCFETGTDGGGMDSELMRLESSGRQFEGVRGYMSPEFKSTGIATEKSDVFAFGVLILELLSGEEPLRYKYDKASGEYRKIGIIETAREAVDCGEDAVEGRLRTWVDRRLRDSFPVEVAGKLTRLVLECVQDDPNKRPDMKRVAGKISKLYLESKMWSERMNVPSDFTASFAPR